MAHANGKLIVEIEAQDPNDCVEMLEELDDNTEVVDASDYPEDPHPDELAEGLPLKISGHRYRWHYSSRPDEYRGNQEALGFSVGFTPKKYGGTTDLETVKERVTELSAFADLVESETDRDCESYMTVVTV